LKWSVNILIDQFEKKQYIIEKRSVTNSILISKKLN